MAVTRRQVRASFSEMTGPKEYRLVSFRGTAVLISKNRGPVEKTWFL